MMGKVYIVGAGCGSYELLTLKAKEILSFCDCVIYDRLVDESVLQFVNKNAELVYLGKEHENPMRQNTINETILKYSSNGKIVARLKGGDPLVFGRGGEELDFLYDNNIDFEIVPGISSSIASCEYAGIPLTYRNISRSFHVFTAHAMREYNFLNFEIISKLEGTLVFLMGVANLEKIVNGLIENGKSKESRISIVENACRPKQRVIVGKLENIVKLQKESKIKSPATIIIGDVVEFQNKFSWYDKMPLSGKSVLITRPKYHGNYLYNKLINLGAECYTLPLISIEEIEENEEYNKKNFLENLKVYKAILFCSANGVNAFINGIDDLRVLNNIKIGVVGKATFDAIKKYKINPDFCPNKFLVEELIKESVRHTDINDNILIITSNLSQIKVDDINKKYNRNFVKLELYNTNKIKYKKEELIDYINKANYITLFSPSSVESLLESIDYEISLIENKKIVSVGPITSKKITDNNLKVYLEAKEYCADGVIESLLND